MQVSFGVHEDEESAARQYDRALLIEKGRAAKTNFPLPHYEKEAKEFEEFVISRYVVLTGSVPCCRHLLSQWVNRSICQNSQRWHVVPEPTTSVRMEGLTAHADLLYHCVFAAISVVCRLRLYMNVK